ncbi:MAG TPA: OmpA family protein [Sphingomonas sp.]|jgi:outer membrane protein OmpA-like peptidoglycan-associated protein|uniref:OmpA family protein n=1 Tax=Sphingomonas sp. TaxID=28214 RepID=UPI002ED7AA99
MRHIKIIAAAMLVLTTTTACVTDPETGQRTVSKAAIGAGLGGLGGLLAGDVLGGRRDRTEKILGAGIGAIAGGAVGGYMDRQEQRLRQQTAGTGVEVRREGDELLLNIPSGITFDTNSYAIQPQFRATLDKVAATLSEYDQTLVDIYGHTDSTGNDAINLPLSRNRAQSVADYLTTRGVQAARLATQGFGAAQPVASNDTPDGRAQNRRVEIKIVPVRDDRG